jgi:hypothetical protein
MPPERSEGPPLAPGDTWYPRGKGLARTIVSCETTADGGRWVRYRTKHREFAVVDREFWFWIERMSASPGKPSGDGYT